jgi:hypothetical protein
VRQERKSGHSGASPWSKTLYLIGTGFSKGICPQIPLNNELLDELISKTSSPELLEYANIFPTKDIERLLTWMHLGVKGKTPEQLENDRRAIDRSIVLYFSQFCLDNVCDSSKKWLRRFAKEVLQPNDAIVSLNYECLLEGALDYNEAWSPNGGYPRYVSIPEGFGIPQVDGCAVIYKIHGSVNFHEDELVQSEPHPTSGRVIKCEVNPRLFPWSCSHISVNSPSRLSSPAIISPSYVKKSYMDTALMMLEVLDIAKTANALVVIGCSWRPEDFFLKMMLLRFFPGKQYSPKRLIIVDPNPENIITEMNKFWIEDVGFCFDVRKITGGIQTSIDKLLTVLAS